MPKWPDHVDERLAHGALCHVCPLNGQRKVGHDGPLDVEHIVIAEAPGEKEEEYKITKGVKYGRPLGGPTGYYMKLNQLAPVGLVELLPGRDERYPIPVLKGVHLMNVIMCRPPKNKIDSKEGKQAQRCCANSARWFLNERLRENPNIMLNPMGGAALSLVRGEKTPIEPYRGRPTGPHSTLQLEYEPEDAIFKYVLRGRKPPEESIWWTVEPVLKLILRASRVGVRRASKRLPPEVSQIFAIVKLMLTKQRTALKKRTTMENHLALK